MAENETPTVDQEQGAQQQGEQAAVEPQEQGEQAVAVEEAPFQYPIKVEEASPGTKKVTIEIPRERIDSKLEEQYKELRQGAVIPGFRKGRAPKKLIEKKFSNDIKNEVRRSLISESYKQAIEQNALNVLGEPDFENPDAIKLPDAGPLSYSFTVEIQPEFTVGETAGIKVKKPRIEVTEEHVTQAMQNLREQQGHMAAAEDGVKTRDFVLADVHVKLDGTVIHHQHGTQLIARPGKVGGVQVDDLDQKLEGAKPGDARTIQATAPDNHPTESIRGKAVEIEIAIKDVKRLIAAEINREFMDDLGFATEDELREALKGQMLERIDADVKRTMRRQVIDHLLANTTVEVPSRLSERQTDRIVNRRAMDLMMQGISRELIRANIERLKSGAAEEAARELKSFFILQKLAEQYEVDVNEGELNGRIAQLAAQRGERPEKVKQAMAKDGSLANLYVSMKEEKAIDKVLETAEIEEVEAAKPDTTLGAGEQQGGEQVDATAGEASMKAAPEGDAASQPEQPAAEGGAQEHSST